jgi:hypothetical protein
MIHPNQNNPKKICQTVEKLLLPVTISQADVAEFFQLKTEHIPSSNPITVMRENGWQQNKLPSA